MIATFATQNYWPHLYLLLLSYDFFNEGNAVVYLMGWKQDAVRKITETFPSNVYIQKNISIEEKKRVADDRRANSLVRKKPSLILETYNSFDASFLWIDADSIVTGDLSPLTDQLDKYDMMATYRPSYKEYAKFAVAVLGFGKNEKGKAVLKEYAYEAAVSKGYNNWYFDQISLYHVYKKIPEINLYRLSEREHSIKCSEGSLIISKREKMGHKEFIDILRSKGVRIGETYAL